MTIGERVRRARKHAELTQAELGKVVGVKQATISDLEKGDSRSSAYLVQIARACHVDPNWLATGKGSMHSARDGGSVYEIDRNITVAPAMPGLCPEISWVKAGQWAESVDIDPDPESCAWHPRPLGASDQTFVLRVVGDSMLPEYPPGRLIFVDPERAAMNNDDVIAVLTETNEATFKRLIEEPGIGRLLKALNPAWRDPYLPINGNCSIIGVVVADMRLR